MSTETMSGFYLPLSDPGKDIGLTGGFGYGYRGVDPPELEPCLPGDPDDVARRCLADEAAIALDILKNRLKEPPL